MLSKYSSCDILVITLVALRQRNDRIFVRFLRNALIHTGHTPNFRIWTAA